MKLNLVEEKENPFLGRIKVTYCAEHPHEPTPSKANLQAWIAKERSIEPEKVEIKQVITEVGRPVSNITVYLWREKNVKDLSKKEVEKNGKEEKREEGEEKPEG